MKIGSIIMDCGKFDKMLAFWQEALHYVPREPAKDGWVVLRDPEGRNPNVCDRNSNLALLNLHEFYGWLLLRCIATKTKSKMSITPSHFVSARTSRIGWDLPNCIATTVKS